MNTITLKNSSVVVQEGNLPFEIYKVYSGYEEPDYFLSDDINHVIKLKGGHRGRYIEKIESISLEEFYSDYQKGFPERNPEELVQDCIDKWRWSKGCIVVKMWEALEGGLVENKGLIIPIVFDTRKIFSKNK